MHTSIMCINILQNIKAVVPKLYEKIAGQTMYLYPDGRTDGQGVNQYAPPPPHSSLRGYKKNEVQFSPESELVL